MELDALAIVSVHPRTECRSKLREPRSSPRAKSCTTCTADCRPASLPLCSSLAGSLKMSVIPEYSSLTSPSGLPSMLSDPNDLHAKPPRRRQ